MGRRLSADIDMRVMVLPQRPFFPNDKLRAALAHPETADHYSDAALRQALHDALLPDSARRLDEQAEAELYR